MVQTICFPGSQRQFRDFQSVEIGPREFRPNLCRKKKYTVNKFKNKRTIKTRHQTMQILLCVFSKLGTDIGKSEWEPTPTTVNHHPTTATRQATTMTRSPGADTRQPWHDHQARTPDNQQPAVDNNFQQSSVADLDPGSCDFFTPGSGILDLYFRELRNNILGYNT